MNWFKKLKGWQKFSVIAILVIVVGAIATGGGNSEPTGYVGNPDKEYQTDKEEYGDTYCATCSDKFYGKDGYVGKLDGSDMGGPANEMFYEKGSYCSNICSAKSYE